MDQVDLQRRNCFQHLNSHLYEVIFTKHLLKVVQKHGGNDLEMLIIPLKQRMQNDSKTGENSFRLSLVKVSTNFLDFQK